jgi:hypothetical protein
MRRMIMEYNSISKKSKRRWNRSKIVKKQKEQKEHRK